MFKGSITALVTPFSGGRLDESAFRDLVQWQISQGTHGLVPCGTTGESPTLTHAEHERVIEICVEQAKGRVPVIAGAGANDTARAVALTRHAKEVGADAALSVSPYYNKPDQEGLYAHFATVADAVELPLILYNIPGRSVVDIADATLARLARHPNIAGVKDATGDIARVSRQRAACGADFVLLSGEDASTLGFMAHGGQGAISVTSNVAPAACSAFQEHCMAGRFAEARALHERLLALHDAMFSSPSPGPAKYALSRLGKCAPGVRLPILEPGAPARERIDAAMRSLDMAEANV